MCLRATPGLVLRAWEGAELARQYEARGAVSFRGFVEDLLQAAEDGKQPEATIYEEGSEGVRMISVHKAKGLEFPIVILADITAKLARDNPDRYIDAERGLCAVNLAGWTPQDVIDHDAEEHARDVAEGIRVAYVAATRARDVLVVPAIGDHPYRQQYLKAEGWWVEPLYGALYPPPDRRQNSTQASMCPKFGIDSVLKRPDGDPASETTVRPGVHGFGAGPDAYSVVWWDPKTLDLGKAPSFSIRQQELLEKGAEDVVKRQLSDYQQWSDARTEMLARGAVPSIRFQTATDRSRAEIPFALDVEVVEIAKEPRPYGPRFGSLVHRILASVPLNGGGAEVSRTAELEARILGAKEEEVEAAIVAVSAALQHPLMQRARVAAGNGECHRELPLTLRMDDGVLIEGVADLVFREGDRWIVVDFKTDQELASELERYRRQVSLYAKTMSEVHKAGMEAYLMRV